MENKDYGKDAAWTVVDADGKLVADGVHKGFDQSVLRQIKEYLHPPQAISEPEKQEILSGHTFPSEANISSGSHTEKRSLENWQKYMENGEYLRSIEGGKNIITALLTGIKITAKRRRAGCLCWQNFGRNMQRLPGGAESSHNRWQWQRIWSADGNRKRRSTWLRGAGASPFRCLFVFSLCLLSGSVRQAVNP